LVLADLSGTLLYRGLRVECKGVKENFTEKKYSYFLRPGH